MKGSIYTPLLRSAIFRTSSWPRQPKVTARTFIRRLQLTRDLIGFHESLVEIESISGNEQGVGEWLVNSLRSQGYNVEKQYLSKQRERFNILAWPGEERDARVMLTTHIDTASLLYTIE